MADTRTHIFISYSRHDSEFVDRLQEDLQIRNFDPWVDRQRLEGGEEWARAIQRELDRCQVVLVALSPDAIDSNWVRREITYAVMAKKRIIPLRIRDVDKVPILVADLQFIDFLNAYDEGLRSLLVALTTVLEMAIPPPVTTTTPSLSAPTTPELMRSAEAPDLIDLVKPSAPPPPPDPNLNSLFMAGQAAKSSGDLERTAIYWQQILDRNPDFGNGIVVKEFAKLQDQLLPIRIRQLREHARAAHEKGDLRQETGALRALLGLDPDDIQAARDLGDVLRLRANNAEHEGNWEEAIGAWRALLTLDAGDTNVTERLDVATQNQQWQWLYDDAKAFATDATPNIGALRDALETLWQNAPYYGDPARLSVDAGLQPPPSFDEVKAIKLKQEQEAAEAEHAARAEEERKRQEQAAIDAERRALEREEKRRKDEADAERRKQDLEALRRKQEAEAERRRAEDARARKAQITRRAFIGTGVVILGSAACGGIAWAAFHDGALYHTYQSHSGPVNAVAYKPQVQSATVCASGSDDMTVRVWDSYRTLQTYKGHAAPVVAISWLNNGSQMASASRDGEVHIWHPSNGSKIYVYRGHTGPVNALQWLPAGSRVASGGDDATVRIWNAQDGGSAFVYQGHVGAINGVSWSPDSTRIASAGADSTVQIWDDRAGGHQYMTYQAHNSPVLAVAWAPSGHYIASADETGVVLVWEASSGKLLTRYTGHSARVNALSWSSDSTRLASGSDDKSIHIWNVSTGGTSYVYRGHSAAVRGLSWGYFIASGSADKTVKVWVP